MAEPKRFVVAKIEHTGKHPRLGASQTIPVHLVIRYGFSDLANDGQFNGTNEEIVQDNSVLDPDIDEQDWYWNSSTEEFQQTAP